jgi:hypothetical protein
LAEVLEEYGILVPVSIVYKKPFAFFPK